MNRRRFLQTSAASGGALLLSPPAAVAANHEAIPSPSPAPVPPTAVAARAAKLPDLSPARWIWYPSGRTLQNTFLLFRRELVLDAAPRRVTGWITADSRYRLEVNGTRVQWGPAPCDPRWQEADPVDLTALLRPGRNVMGATVLYYGQGDGTWPIGKPGFLAWLEIEHADGRVERVGTDASWRVLLCRAWRPGQFKRWYLRALQEDFDARRFPYGWCEPSFAPGADWLPAMPLEGSPQQPALAAHYPEYQLDVGAAAGNTELRPRRLPRLTENWVPVQTLRESHRFEWVRPAEDYFEFRVPDAYRATPGAAVKETGPGQWEVVLDGTHAAGLTFELKEQVVGWPAFTLEAAAGTIVELLVHEAHQPGGPALINSHFESWTRFTCREGTNRFETFDFESLRWLQLHVRGPAGTVRLREVGVRRRQFPWPNTPRLRTREPALQRLFDASINTLHNCAQETLVDGMARERQQYSGDGGHQLHAVHLAFGESRLPARFVSTFSQGLTKDGYFLDCWPAYDRLARLAERQLDLSGWGPILDHGVGFMGDCWHHWQYSGELEDVREPYPRLVRFAQYLQGIAGRDGLLPVENLGIPSVWIDHVAYQRQRHKQCAFNLYAAAMLEHALAPLARAFGDARTASAAQAFGRSLREAAVRTFWSRTERLFVNNRPWLAEEKTPRYCDRSLATAVLFDQCPGGHTAAAVRLLAEAPARLGFSYPCNAGWRLWALARGGRADVIVHDLRTRWAGLTSVLENNTLQEDWEARHDAGQQWSHCAVAPIYITFHGLAGLRPLAPGFTSCELRPQLADLESLELTAHTARGPIELEADGSPAQRRVRLRLPAGCAGELVLPRGEVVGLERVAGPSPEGTVRYRLPEGETRLVLGGGS